MQAQVKRFLHEEQALGKIQYVQANRLGPRKTIGKRTSPLEIASTIDYDLWLGPAADQPIYRDKLHYDWHWDFNTGNGEMGNWGVHILGRCSECRVSGPGHDTKPDRGRRRSCRLE